MGRARTRCDSGTRTPTKKDWPKKKFYSTLPRFQIATKRKPRGKHAGKMLVTFFTNTLSTFWITLVILQRFISFLVQFCVGFDKFREHRRPRYKMDFKSNNLRFLGFSLCQSRGFAQPKNVSIFSLHSPLPPTAFCHFFSSAWDNRT